MDDGKPTVHLEIVAFRDKVKHGLGAKSATFVPCTSVHHPRDGYFSVERNVYNTQFTRHNIVVCSNSETRNANSGSYIYLGQDRYELERVVDISGC